jgi:hypothetical protein
VHNFTVEEFLSLDSFQFLDIRPKFSNNILPMKFWLTQYLRDREYKAMKEKENEKKKEYERMVKMLEFVNGLKERKEQSKIGWEQYLQDEEDKFKELGYPPKRIISFSQHSLLFESEKEGHRIVVKVVEESDDYSRRRRNS